MISSERYSPVFKLCASQGSNIFEGHLLGKKVSQNKKPCVKIYLTVNKHKPPFDFKISTDICPW